MIFRVILLLALDNPPNTLFDGLQSPDDAKSILGSGVGSDDISPEKQCEAAIFQYNEVCPGFQAIDIVASNSTDIDALRRFCPCVSRAARRANLNAFHEMDRTCGTAFATSISYLSNIVCAQPESKLRYCGAKVAEINGVFSDITKILNGSKNHLSAENRTAMQKLLDNLCDPCFEEISVGLVRWLSESHAAGHVHPSEPNDGPSEITTIIGKLLDSRILCARNNNAAQVQNGEAFCVPWLLGEMLPLGSRCVDVQPKRDGPPTVAAQRECLKDDECVWYSGSACGSLVDHFTNASTYAHLPPRAIHNSTATNSCFLTIQNIIQQNKAILSDAVVAGQATDAVFDDMQRAAKALETVSAYAWMRDDTVASRQSCLTRWREYDFGKIQSDCTEAEIESLRADDVQCGQKCVAAWKDVIAEFGCCYGVLREIQEALDPNNSMLPNFSGIEQTCGVKALTACDAFSKERREITLYARAVTCGDIHSSNHEIVMDAIQQDVAYLLGVPKASVRDLSIAHSDGSSCNKSPQTAETGLLQVRCAIALQDADRLERVAATANDTTSPVFLPTVHYILEKDGEIEKRMEILRKQQTAKRAENGEKLMYLPYKLWAISLCVLVVVLIIAIFLILVWRDKITFVWCWSCQYFMRRRRPRSGRKSL